MRDAIVEYQDYNRAFARAAARVVGVAGVVFSFPGSAWERTAREALPRFFARI